MTNTSFSTLFNLITTTNQFTRCKNLKEVKQSHAQITKKGLTAGPELIFSCAQIATLESMEYARKAYESYERDYTSTASLVMVNSLIKGYSAAGFVDAALLIYAQATEKGLAPDKHTLHFLLHGCTKAGFFREGIQLHGSVLKLGWKGHLTVQNGLIYFYAECGKFGTAKKVFNEMSERNAGSWNCLICACAQRGKPELAVSLFFEMVEKADIKPDLITLMGAISACAKLRDLDMGERVSAYISETGIKVDTFVANAFVDMYMKCGATDRAKQLFDKFVYKNLASYNALLSNYVRQGMEREALAVLGEMLQLGHQPDRVTMIIVASAITQLGDFAFARQLHGYITRNRLDDWDTVVNSIIKMYASCGRQELACRVFYRISNKSVVLTNSLIAGFAKNGDIDSAWAFFNKMPQTDVVTWNIMIGDLLRRRLFHDAVELFREMQNEGVKPNELTMFITASACGHLGDLDLAKWLYSCIENQGIYRDSKLDKAIADMFTRCGGSESARMFDKVESTDVDFPSDPKKKETTDVSCWTRMLEILDEIPRRSVRNSQMRDPA